MTSPPYGFGAHDRGGLHLCKSEQRLQSSFERRRLHVIRTRGVPDREQHRLIAHGTSAYTSLPSTAAPGKSALAAAR